MFSDYKNFKTAVANNFEPSEECLATAKIECKEHGIDEIEFEDVDQFYLETKMNLKLNRYRNMIVDFTDKILELKKRKTLNKPFEFRVDLRSFQSMLKMKKVT